MGWIETMRLKRTKRSGKAAKTCLENISKAHFRRGRVMPTDIDFHLHMNNARYLRECDFGRMRLLLRTGLWAATKRQKGFIVLGASTIRYRKPLNLFNPFVLSSKIVHWDKSNVYIEQRFEHPVTSFVYAVVYAKQSFVNISSISELITEVCNCHLTPPPLPHDLKCWIDFNEASSARLRPSKN